MSGSKDEGQKYYVEKLVSKRILGSGQVEYEVKWMGWESSSNTWENSEMLMEDCPNLVVDFENANKESEEDKRRRRSPALALEEDAEEEEQQADIAVARESVDDDDDDGRGEMGQDSGSGDKIEIIENNQARKRQAPLEPMGSKVKKAKTNEETSSSSVPVPLEVPPTQEKKSKKKQIPEVTKFCKRKLIPERILGITQDSVTKQLQFLIKWKDSGIANLVPASRAHKGCPLLVIKFYENRLIWRNNPTLPSDLNDESEEETGREPEDEYCSDFDWEIIE